MWRWFLSVTIITEAIKKITIVHLFVLSIVFTYSLSLSLPEMWQQFSVDIFILRMFLSRLSARQIVTLFPMGRTS